MTRQMRERYFLRSPFGLPEALRLPDLVIEECACPERGLLGDAQGFTTGTQDNLRNFTDFAESTRSMSGDSATRAQEVERQACERRVAGSVFGGKRYIEVSKNKNICESESLINDFARFAAPRRSQKERRERRLRRQFDVVFVVDPLGSAALKLVRNFLVAYPHSYSA